MENFISAHLAIITAVAGYSFVAAVNNLPDPGQKFEFYPWFSGTLKTLVNSPAVKKFKDAEPIAAKNTEVK
jgi:hypothetical protein